MKLVSITTAAMIRCMILTMVLVGVSGAMENTVLKKASRGETFTISGTTGLKGVVMRGLPGDPISDTQGRYAATVEKDWSGTVTPVKEGYTFDPPARMYQGVTADCGNQDFVAQLQMFTISGSTGLPGVLMQGLPDMPISRPDGSYRATVPYGWAGTVSPQKEGCQFAPARRTYQKMTKDQTNQDYGFQTFGPANMSYSNTTTDMEDGKSQLPVRSRGRIVTRQRATGYETAAGPSAKTRVVVVPTIEVKDEEFEALTEDIRVMSHILQKEFQEPQTAPGVFVDYGGFFGGPDRTIEALYIQGYGALFFIEVEFPLVMPPQPPQQQAEKPTEHVDPIWRQAQDEIMSAQDPTAGLRPQPQREQRTADELKSNLIKALKHASNIRHLKPEESVILTIISNGINNRTTTGTYGPYTYYEGNYGMGGFGGGYRGGYTDGGGYGGGGYTGGGVTFGTGGRPFGPYSSSRSSSVTEQTTMTICAKKSDIDAFAKDKLDFEAFRKLAKIFTY
jgi:hypothetical protein